MRVILCQFHAGNGQGFIEWEQGTGGDSEWQYDIAMRISFRFITFDMKLQISVFMMKFYFTSMFKIFSTKTAIQRRNTSDIADL